MRTNLFSTYYKVENTIIHKYNSVNGYDLFFFSHVLLEKKFAMKEYNMINVEI